LKSESVPIVERVRGSNESSFVGEKDLFEVQDRTPCRGGEGDLREPEAQAAAGMRLDDRNSKFGRRKLRLEVEFRFSNFDFRLLIEVNRG
jgi:hypothetical protein